MTDTTTIRSFLDVKGWFTWLDRKMFSAVLQAQDGSPPGDLVELGTYLGRSTVIVGDHLRDGERFVVVDLFGRTELLGRSGDELANRLEAETSYKTLTRLQFEMNYLALHESLPEIVEGFSSEIVDHVAAGSARFVHIDASHLFPQVRIDVQSTKTMLRPGGIAVFDDYRSEHTPGVAAAVWEAILSHGLIPVAVTPMKLYGVFDDPTPYVDAINRLVASEPMFWSEEQEILDRKVLRLAQLKAPEPAEPKQPPASASAITTPDTPATSAAPPSVTPATRTAGQPPSALRRFRRMVATDLAPPILTRWWLARRR